MRINLTIKAVVMLTVMLMLPVSGIAKEAQPMAADPEMEKLVNEISAELRCLVCQNQTIADSHAELAVDLKNQVRDMVAKGQTQEQIVDYMVQRYGDFVRYRPPVKPMTYLLWVGPFLLLLIGFTILIINLRKRKAVIADAPLSEEEHARVDSILHSKEKSDTGAASEGEGK